MFCAHRDCCVDDSGRVHWDCVLGFGLYCDGLGIALLSFICECHRDLDLREVDGSLCGVQNCGVFT